MSILVQEPDGTYVQKSPDELRPDDLVVLDGPDAFEAEKKLQAGLDAEVAAAGGFEAWRARGRPARG